MFSHQYCVDLLKDMFNISSYMIIFYTQTMKFALLLKTKKTVFKIDDLYQILWLENKFSLRNLVFRWGKEWLLKNVFYWIWCLPNYNEYELANILQRPSYISLETVLYQKWIIFQNYSNSISSVWLKSRSITVWKKTYTYNTIKKEIFYNQTWIVYKDGYAIATLERALCDRIYLSPSYHFDNLRSINWNKVLEIAKIYDNKRLILDIEKLKNGTKY